MQKPKFTPVLSNLTLIHQGKTRDTFATKFSDELLVVATNRLSTHNVIHLSEVPYKGRVLTALTIFWLTDLLKKALIIPNHLVAYGINIYSHLPGKRSDYPDDLHLQAIIVRKLQMIPVEFIHRMYLAGSLYKQFYSKGLPNPYGFGIEPGLPVMSPFPVPAFTPTDKSETDEPLNAAETMISYSEAYTLSFRVFKLIQEHLRRLDLELVDSKFELGVSQSGEAVLADEIATPDSSRFCELSEIKLGIEPSWLDKQIARDEAERIWRSGPKCSLEFGPEIIHKLSETYLRIFWRITGFHLPVFASQRLDV